MLRKNIVIINKLGLHARAAAKFVAHASRFASDIQVIRNGHHVNGKSIMGIMMLAAAKGSEIEIIASGEDELDAVEDLVSLIEQRFDESE